MLAVGEFLATTATVRVPVLDGSIVDYVSCMSADDRQSTYERTNSYIYTYMSHQEPTAQPFASLGPCPQPRAQVSV